MTTQRPFCYLPSCEVGDCTRSTLQDRRINHEQFLPTEEFSKQSNPDRSMIDTIFAETMYTETFRQWKTLHDHFVQSIQEYLTACTSLEFAFSQPPRSVLEKSNLEAAFLHINEQLSLASTYDKQLQQAWGCLSRIRNHSIKLVPINILPPEILSDIFVLANPTRDVCISHLLPANKPPKPTCLDSILSV